LPPTAAAAAATTVEATAVVVTSCASVATAASVALTWVSQAGIGGHSLGGAGVGLLSGAAPYY